MSRDLIATLLTIGITFLGWIVVSVVLALFVGACIRFGMGGGDKR